MAKEKRPEEPEGKDVEAHGPVDSRPAGGAPTGGRADDPETTEEDVEAHGPLGPAPVDSAPVDS